MIEWFGGSSRSDVKYASGDDGATFIDNAPETPAPLFVVRAFKTAIFGTPKPIEYKNTQEKLLQSTERKIAEGVQVEQDPKRVDPPTRRMSMEAGIKLQEELAVRDSAVRNINDQLASRTKGILLTPGTAATRRKTVSFSARKDLADHAKSPNHSIGFESKLAATGSPSIQRAREGPRKQTALTKTLIELSTKRSSPPVAAGKAVELAACERLAEKNVIEEAIECPDRSEALSNLTLDLSQPCSRSGQHWKAEYDEYHKNSTREMKKIIQYGQNVKSYAAKKDYEATNLNETLQKELAKVARMDTKISKMSKQLRMATAQNPHGDSEQTRLVGELAQQTALTVRYQKKAEQYRKAISRLPSDIDIGDHNSIMEEALPPQGYEDSEDQIPMTSMQTELHQLREVAATAERKAARLEDENKRLKRSLARVKEEMTTYDSKRQIKEERLKKRDERHKTSKEACEAELAKLKIDYNELLKASRLQGMTSQWKTQPLGNLLASTDKENLATQQQAKGIPHTTTQYQARQPSNSPRKRRPKNPAVDIWTADGPGIESEQFMPNNGFNVLKPPYEAYDIHRALQEVQFNPPVSEQHHQPQEAKVTHMQALSENVRPATEPLSKRDVAEDLIDSAFARQRLSQSFVGRSASLLDSRAVSRTSTMGTARTSSLSAERAAAAKARLAERKRSGEKKKVQVEGKVGSMR